MLNFRQGNSRRSVVWTASQRGGMAMLMIFLGLTIGICAGHNPLALFRVLGGGQARGPQGEAIDTRVPESRPGDELAGTFHAPLDTASPPPAEKPEGADRYFPGVDPARLAAIQDDRPFFLGEHDAWFHLMAILQKNDEPALVKASQGTVTFVQLFRQADEYRGRLVTLSGTVRQCDHKKAPKNEYGITEYYQTWITPVDAPAYVAVVYALQLPKGFPTGSNLAEEVTVTGFSYKRWVYRAQKDLHTAPVLFSRTLHWQKKRPLLAASPEHDPWTIALIAVGAAVAGTGIAMFLLRRAKTPPSSMTAPAELDRVLANLDKQGDGEKVP